MTGDNKNINVIADKNAPKSSEAEKEAHEAENVFNKKQETETADQRTLIRSPEMKHRKEVVGHVVATDADRSWQYSCVVYHLVDAGEINDGTVMMMLMMMMMMMII